jgi:curved DNA-binding protein CbpA
MLDFYRTPDFYRILQVDSDAAPAVIRAAYRRLAREYHPDAGGDVRRMVALNAAWQVLGDPGRRAAYDGARAAANKPRHSAPTTPQTTAPWRDIEVVAVGAPPGRPSGTVIDFGRYAGWSVGELASHDPDYLEWLERTTIGRPFRREIEALLGQRREAILRARPPQPTRGRR